MKLRRRCAAQIRCTVRKDRPVALAIIRPVQWVASPGGSAQVSATTCCTVVSGVRGLPGRLVRRAGEPVDAGLGEAPLPAPDRRPADPSAAGDLRHVQPLGRVQDDPRPRRVLLRPVAIGHDRRQALAIPRRDNGTDRMGHGHAIAHLGTSMNLPNASVHQHYPATFIAGGDARSAAGSGGSAAGCG